MVINLFPQICYGKVPSVAAKDDLRPEKQVSKKENRLNYYLRRFRLSLHAMNQVVIFFFRLSKAAQIFCLH
jgi:hypothetical protein